MHGTSFPREPEAHLVGCGLEAWQISKADLARMKSLTEDEDMYERAKELRDRVHRDGVR